MSEVKLTKPQRDLLHDIADFDGGRTINESYPPAQKLVGLGLAKMQKTRFGGCIIAITPAGRAALEASLKALEEALQEAADEFDGTVTGAERMQTICRATLNSREKGE